MELIIDAKEIVFEYNTYDDNGKIEQTVRALNKTSIQVQKGEFVVVLGHNGSGKSTFAKHLNGILSPKAGELMGKWY